MSLPTDWDIANEMEMCGGSFAQALGVLFWRADDINRAKLKAAFPEIWAEYAEIATLHAARKSQ